MLLVPKWSENFMHYFKKHDYLPKKNESSLQEEYGSINKF